MLSVVITVATAAYLALIYPTLPNALPIRYVRGSALIHQIKSPAMVFIPAMVQAGLLVVFGLLGVLLLWRPHRTASDPKTIQDGDRMRLAAEGIALLGLLWISVQAIGAARLMVLWQTPTGSGFGAIYNAVVLTAIAISFVLVKRTMNLVGKERVTAPTVDPASWRLTHLYFNPADPALFVPTRRGVGWTLNFGRPVAIALMAGILGIGISGPFYLARLILGVGN